MLGPASFGHAGAGGQLGFADAELGVGFAYLSNQMGGYGDARARELTRAVRAAHRRLTGARGHAMRAGGHRPRPELLTYPDSLGGDLPRLARCSTGRLTGCSAASTSFRRSRPPAIAGSRR